MRYYPDMKDKYDVEELEQLNVKDWMVELLKVNPNYLSWGNHEDYMSSGTGWGQPITAPNVKELLSLDDYNEVVNFYFNLTRDSKNCYYCDGRGLNKETRKLEDNWSSSWQYHLEQPEVDALFKAGRLKEYANVPFAQEINTRVQLGDLFLDSMDKHVCIKAKGEAMGTYGMCTKCEGAGYTYTEEEGHVELQLWVLHPRKGVSRGYLIEHIEEKDLPEVFKLLRQARDRNNDKFKGVDLY